MARRPPTHQTPSVALTNLRSSQASFGPVILSDVDGIHSALDGTEEVLGDDAYIDGGIGWVMTACAFVLMFQFLGILYSWGVIQADLLKKGLAESRSLSAIGAVSAFSLATSCLPASWLLPRLRPKWSALIGVLVTSASLGLAGFATDSLPGLIFLQGVMFGCGGSMVYLTAYTIPSQFFLRKRGLATGIASCGGAIGGAIWSIITERLIAAWGLAWTYRFCGLATVVIGVPAALMLRPGHIARRPTANVAVVEKGIFRSSRYIRTLIACFVASYPFFIPPFYISQYSQSVGLSASSGALYSALFNVASAAGRILFGILADFAFGNLNSWMSSLGLIVLSSLLIWPFATSAGPIAAFVLVCGLGSGGFFSLQSSIVAQIIGSHRLNYGVGWLEAAQSLGFLAGPITAGALLDAFGGASKGAAPYRPAMFLVGATTALSLVLIGSVRFSTSRKIFKRV